MISMRLRALLAVEAPAVVALAALHGFS